MKSLIYRCFSTSAAFALITVLFSFCGSGNPASGRPPDSHQETQSVTEKLANYNAQSLESLHAVATGKNCSPAMADLINRAMTEWFYKIYLPAMASASDLRVNMMKANLNALPANSILANGYDLLQKEGKMPADKIKEQTAGFTYWN